MHPAVAPFSIPFRFVRHGETTANLDETVAGSLAVPLIVAHSGVFRVLCRTLLLPEPRDPVTNCQPVRLVPPSGGAPWRAEFLPMVPAGA